MGKSSSPIDDLVEEFYYFVVKDLISHKINNQNTIKYINRLIYLDEKLLQSKKVQSAAERFSKSDLFKALSGIDHLMKTGCVGDLAQRNIMVRPSTGQMVFIDPVYKDKV